MIPNFSTFSSKYIRVAVLPVIVVSALLTSSLIRNVINITLPEIIAGLGAICLSIVWSMMRDGRGYWVYSVFTMRMYESPEDIARYMRSLTLEGRSKLFYRPFWASLLTLCAVVLFSTAIWWCGPSYRYVLIGLLGVVVLPAVMLWQLDKSIPFCILNALLIHDKPNEYQAKPRRLPSCLAEDLLLSLLINFALVLPIARKPAFSLAGGYANPAFIVAFIILLTIVMLFMFCFAIRPRRYVIFGELLIGNIKDDFAPVTPCAVTSKLSRPWRLVIWLLLIAIWSIVICLIFNGIGMTPSFTPLYLCSLLPIIAIYCAERYQVLYTNFLEAQEMKLRYEVVSAEYMANRNKSIA